MGAFPNNKDWILLQPRDATSNDAATAQSNDMQYSMGQAAKRLKINKSTLSRHRRAGRFSAEKDENGSYIIDESELARAYPDRYMSNDAATAQSNDTEHQETPLDTTAELARLRAENALLWDERDNLRERLDAEAEERRKLTAMLTDQRQKPSKSFWSRLLGRST